MSIFRFKQFNIEQTGCAMKINTDGVLLGALAEATEPESILDIGTGTGVIALMLAQRYSNAKIDAVEIDKTAALAAGRNFKGSPFAERMNVYPLSFEHYFEQYPHWKYDLIVSNPPFYINSLKSLGAQKAIAKHTDANFLKKIIFHYGQHLSESGAGWLILPTDVATLVKEILAKYGLHLQKTIKIYSFRTHQHHREVLVCNKTKSISSEEDFVIYDEPQVYNRDYRVLLKDFLTIF